MRRNLKDESEHSRGDREKAQKRQIIVEFELKGKRRWGEHVNGTREMIQRGAKLILTVRNTEKMEWGFIKLSFTQWQRDQLQVTDSSRDRGRCQFAGMAQNLPRSCAARQKRPPDWQLVWLHIRKRGRKSPAASSRSFFRMP